MPELPEVETIKKAVEKGIGNAKILNIEITSSSPSDLLFITRIFISKLFSL